MADWYLNRALTNWRNAVNAAYPNRDKTSDGTVGDPAHQVRSSDHNPDSDGSVDAWDMDVDLRSGHDAQAIEELKQVFQKHPAARYWIHNRQIAERKYGWVRKPYSGPNPHDKHVHWNSEPTQENSNLPWVIPSAQKEVDMPLTNDDVMKTWTWDLVNGPEKEEAYKVVLRAANQATAAVQGVARLEAKVDALAAKPDVTVDVSDPAVLDAIANRVADLLAVRLQA